MMYVIYPSTKHKANNVFLKSNDKLTLLIVRRQEELEGNAC